MPPSDSGLTAEEQATLDADKAAETTPVEEEAASEPAGDAGEGEVAPEDGQTTQRQSMVPHAALHEAREKERAAVARATEAERKAQVLEERTNLILQRFAAPQPATQPQQPSTPEIPSFDQDPAGHILGQVRQQGAILGELVQAVTGQSRQAEAQAGVQQLTVRASAMEREFAAQNPDYDKASAHLFEMRRQELIAAGWDDPAEIQTMMVNEATGLAARALQQGRNPAAIVYELAKLRGYTTAPPPQETNGAAASAEQLRTIERGQQQSRSVGNLRGAGPAPMTAARLADLDPDEFLQWMGKKEGRALMGE
jgi:hypothetical protein